MPKSNSESDFGGSITSDDSDVDAGPSSHVAASHHIGEAFQLPTPAGPNLNINTNVPSSPPVSPRTKNAFSAAKSPTTYRTPLTVLDAEANGILATGKLRGVALFRASAWKIMRMRQLSAMMGVGRGAGAEPGVDPRRASATATHGHLRENCVIEVVDYSSVQSKFHKFHNKDFIEFLEAKGAQKEPWAKVRWISVGGISWDVLSTLALTYELHPLSLEDVLHQRSRISSKADYFAKHLFLRVLCHSLGVSGSFSDHAGSSDPIPVQITNLPRSSSLAGSRPGKRFSVDNDIGYEAGDDMDLSEKSQTRLFRRINREGVPRRPTRRDLEAGSEQGAVAQARTAMPSSARSEATLDQLKAGARINVLLKNLFIFLLRDGTVISIHQTPSYDFAEPVINRLRSIDTVLRTTADASLLLESILDLVVDRAVEVIDEYQKVIHKLECDVLLKSNMESVRRLHILSGDLSLHKKTLAPFKSLVYGLRRYDLERSIAIAASSADDAAEGDEASRNVIGFLSQKAKVYLADVHDHVEYILSSLDMFAAVSENLIDYTFNMANYEMSQVMRRLTTATIIFLPLTFLTGYFGMNFTNMWSVKHNHSDAIFWKIAVPVMAVVISAFMWSDITSMKRYLEKRMDIKRTRRSQQ